MRTLVDLWAAYRVTLAFGAVNALFALSAYAVLSVGVLSFATVVFASVGGFLAAQLAAAFGWPFLATLPFAAFAGALAAVAVAGAFLRLESHWMALASLALVLIGRVVALNTPALTGGVNGLIVPVRATPFELAGLLGFCALAFWRLDRSVYGLAARAVREDAAVASTMGVSPYRLRFAATVISGAVGGLGGAALAFTLQFLSPDTYFIGLAFTMIASAVLGGAFHWFGPIVGAFVFTALPAAMQAVVPQFEDVAKGLVLLAIMVYLPRGLIDPRRGALRRARRHG